MVLGLESAGPLRADRAEPFLEAVVVVVQAREVRAHVVDAFVQPVSSAYLKPASAAPTVTTVPF